MRVCKRMGCLLASGMLLMASLAGCGDKAGSQERGSGGDSASSAKIGVLFPSVNQPRWTEDGEYMKGIGEQYGYAVEVQFADDSVANQVSQMENMITKGYDVLIISPVDGEALGPTCQQAYDAGTAIISYDRLIRATDCVTYYATFDNTKVGEYCGQFIVDTLDLKSGAGPFHIEIFTGDITDNNAKMTFDGGMAAIQKYLDNGQLVIKSGQKTLEQCQTKGWDSGNAQTRMDNLLSANYTNDQVDAVLSTYGGMSLGIVSSLKAAGYGTAAKPMPVITAQDAEVPTMKSIAAGEITMSILKDSRDLAQIAMDMAKAVVEGEEYPVNDTTTYDNGAFVVPSFLADIDVFTKDNMDELCIDSGLFTKEEIYG